MKSELVTESLRILRKYYLEDERPYCVAYSGGKDSSSIVFLTMQMLKELQEEGIVLLKRVYVVSSNTTAELPTLVAHLHESLQSIDAFAKKHNLPVEVSEVKPLPHHTLNSSFLGVGMPPPTGSLRWCTEKLKIKPIDAYILDRFPDGRFITVTGSRRDESDSRSKRLQDLSVDGSDEELKRNDRYPEANSIAPIEHWSTKDVWEYMFENESDLIDVTNLWKVYSDASDKSASECSFVGAGGKHIDEGKIGCGTSRFGCWQCYVTRGNDKCLDGLLKSGLPDIDHYQEYRNWFWDLTQLPWEETRDYFSHRYMKRELYNKAKNNLVGGTRPSGLSVAVRMRAYFRTMKLNNKISTGDVISEAEVLFIQSRWLREGDYNLTALKIAELEGFEITSDVSDMIEVATKIKALYKELKNAAFDKQWFRRDLKRFSAQYIMNEEKVDNQLYPTRDEAIMIKREWKNMECEDPKYVFKNILAKRARKHIKSLGLFGLDFM